VQWMSAGHGVEHSEFNGAKDAPVHFLQIWIQPDRLNAQPAYEQRAFDPAAREGRWQTLAAPEGAEGGLPLRQQAWLRAVRLVSGQSVDVVLDPARKYWLHVATGDAAYDGRALTAGDALGFAGESGTHRLEGRGTDPADVLFFDLPA
jgi:redox-sensitive bicupin YhaK (pirin superfamily)